MRIMVDTNIIVDVMLKREGFYQKSYEVFELCGSHKIEGFVSASAITDIFIW